MLVLSSCKKSERIEPNSDFQFVKTYNDTTANPSNDNMRLVAGYGKSFISFGTGLFMQNIDGLIEVFLPYHVSIMAIDENGKQIWKSKLLNNLSCERSLTCK